MASDIYKKYLLLAFLLSSLLRYYVGQGCPTNLTNTAVYAGNPFTYTILSNGNNVQWQVAPGTQSTSFNSIYNITNYDNTVDPMFNDTYAVTPTQLFIFNTTVAPQGNMPFSTGGAYILSYQNPDCMTGAGLIVIQSGPLCAVDASDPNNVMMTCSVVYEEYLYQGFKPIMTWTDSNGNVVSTDYTEPTPPDASNPGLQSSVSKYPIASNDASTYNCLLTFSAPQLSPLNYLAMNAPTFNASCFTRNSALTTNTLTTSTVKPTSTAMQTTAKATSTTTISPPASTATQSNALTTTLTKISQSSNAITQPATTTMATTTTVAFDCSSQNLSNTVVYEGNPASFSRVNNGQPAKWQVAASSDIATSLQDINPNYDNNVAAQFNTTYAVNSTQLIIFNSTVAPQGSMPYSTAGIYILNYQNSDCQTGAALTVIKSGPVCTCDASDPNSLKLSCSVVYANYVQQQINPIMTWKNSSGDDVHQEMPDRMTLDINNPGLQYSESLYSTANTGAQTYECQLTFSAPSSESPQPSYVDWNAPNFTASCFIKCGTPMTTMTTASSASTTGQPVTATTTTSTPSTSNSSASTTSSMSPGSPGSSGSPGSPGSSESSVSSSPQSVPSSTPYSASTSLVSLLTQASTASTLSSSQSPPTSPAAGSSTQAATLASPTTPDNQISTRALSVVLGLVFGVIGMTAVSLLCLYFCTPFQQLGTTVATGALGATGATGALGATGVTEAGALGATGVRGATGALEATAQTRFMRPIYWDRRFYSRNNPVPYGF